MVKLQLGRNRFSNFVGTGALLVVIVWLFQSTPVQTQFSPVRELTQPLGFYGGTTSAIDTTGANLLVACVSSHATASETPTISDSKSNSWIAAEESLETSGTHMRLFYSVPTAVGTDHTFTVNGAGTMASIYLTAWSGAASTPLDRTAGDGGDGTSMPPGAVTPTQDNELLISCLTNSGDPSHNNRTIDGGFTLAAEQLGWDETNFTTALAGAYLVQTTAATSNPTWTYPSNTTANAVIATFKTSVASGDLSSYPLFHWDTDATLVGGFRTPNDDGNTSSGYALAYDNNNLYMNVGNEGSASKVLRMTVPSTFTNDLSTMAIAALSQPAVDVTEGNMGELYSPLDYYRNWGLLVYDGKLIGSAFYGYDANNTTRVSHFSHSLDLNQSSFQGWMAVWNPEKTGFVSGPMALVPEYARTALGGPVIATGANASILSRLPFGLAAFAFDPSLITGRTPFTILGYPLMYFDSQKPMQDNAADACGVAGPGGCTQDPSEIWNRATNIGGVVIPTGTRTLLYFGRQGIGDYCYGAGTTIEALHGEPRPEGGRYCYDPVGDYSGEHAYPYRSQVWAFDLNHLAEVKLGTRAYWDVQPYGRWPIEFPVVPDNSSNFTDDARRSKIGGVAYDSANKVIYVTQLGADAGQYKYRSIVWKYTHQ